MNDLVRYKLQIFVADQALNSINAVAPAQISNAGGRG